MKLPIIKDLMYEAGRYSEESTAIFLLTRGQMDEYKRLAEEGDIKSMHKMINETFMGFFENDQKI